MKIRNITASESTKQVCFFDINIENEGLTLESVKIIKQEGGKYKLDLPSSKRRTVFSCRFAWQDVEDKIVNAIISKIPKEWTDRAEEIKLIPIEGEKEQNKLTLELEV